MGAGSEGVMGCNEVGSGGNAGCVISDALSCAESDDLQWVDSHPDSLHTTTTSCSMKGGCTAVCCPADPLAQTTAAA